MKNPISRNGDSIFLKRQASGVSGVEGQPSRPGVMSLPALVALAVLLGGMLPGLAQPEIVSTVPPFMATGVSPTAPVVITFSEAMNPGATTAQFMDATSFPPAFLLASPAWSSGNTVLTCTPVPSWPEGKMIVWFVEGENSQGDPLDGEANGVFTTGNLDSGDCEEVGALTVGKGSLYRQTSAGAPTLDALTPYIFVACATVACTNISTTHVNVGIPGGANVDLLPTLLPGGYSFFDFPATLELLDSGYPAGDYLFTLQSPENTFACTVDFPSSLVTPNAPRLTEFAETQAIDPAQPFVLGWDAFEGGAAEDCIHVELYGGMFQTPQLGMPGALTGAARSVTIPAETLAADESYEGAITFYDLVLSTNSCGYISLVYRSAATEFRLVTAGGRPSLAITHTTTNTFIVSWAASAENWILERTNALPPMPVPWPEVPPPYANDGTRFLMTFTNAPPFGDQFFRLRGP